MRRASRAIFYLGLGLMILTLPVLASGAPEWQKVAPEEEEFSVLVPVAPAVIVQTGDNLYYPWSRQKILEKRHYSAYSDGFIYAIDSYKVKEPKNLLSDMLAAAPSHLRFERDIKLDGYPGKQYVSGGGSQVYYLAASSHVYVVTLAALDQADTSPARFFSAMRLGKGKSAGAARGAKPAPEPQASVAPAAEQEKPFSPKEVTRKARIIWRPEPAYTEAARENGITGTVVLRAVFSSSGQVTNIRTVSGLEHGLTEKAIEAARNIRFFPAMKDGRLVSQYIQIEYNFNLF